MIDGIQCIEDDDKDIRMEKCCWGRNLWSKSFQVSDKKKKKIVVVYNKTKKKDLGIVISKRPAEKHNENENEGNMFRLLANIRTAFAYTKEES